MKGSELRRIIESKGVSLSATAFAMGLPTPMHLQAILKSPDVKSGHLEAAAHALGMTIPEMYAMLDGSQLSEPLPQPVQQQKEEAPAATDIQQVLLHLTALVTAQNQKIDDLTQQVADLSAALQHQHPVRYVSNDPATLQVADQSEIK